MHLFLSTDRLTLRPLTTEDGFFVQQLVNSAGWLEYIGDRNIHSQDAAVVYVQKIIGTANMFYWVVRLKEETPIGIITFMKRTYLESFDIGYAFLPAFSGLGYAFESAAAVLKMVQQEPGRRPVIAITTPGNKTSVRLLEMLGFCYEKEMINDQTLLHLYTT